MLEVPAASSTISAALPDKVIKKGRLKLASAHEPLPPTAAEEASAAYLEIETPAARRFAEDLAMRKARAAPTAPRKSGFARSSSAGGSENLKSAAVRGVRKYEGLRTGIRQGARTQRGTAQHLT